MAIYLFKCDECEYDFDIPVSMDKVGYVVMGWCPKCDKGVYVKRVWTAPAIHIKKGPTEKLGEEMKI